HRPRARARSRRARSPVRALLPWPIRPPRLVRHRHGPLDHARAAVSGRRTDLGGERGKRGGEVLDHCAGIRSRVDGDVLAMPSRVLIVDDEPNIIATVAPLLRAQGYEVFSAMTGQAGLEAVERDKPDLLVLDLGLPDIDGVDVCVRVRQSTSMPILVLSARGAEGDKVRALDAGADDYVTKPF